LDGDYWESDKLLETPRTNQPTHPPTQPLKNSYGAYGSKQFPSFNPADLALLDRGFVLAIGHVRGGSELGAEWHAGGKKVKKVRCVAPGPVAGGRMK
jgi:protease II